MNSQSNTYEGVSKVYWSQVRDRVATVEPIFAQLIDELSPDKAFPLYLAYYPYGAVKGDTEATFLPRGDGTYYRLIASEAPIDIMRNLGYSEKRAPMAIILEKTMETFIDLKNYRTTIPFNIYKPGTIFPFAQIFTKTPSLSHSPNGVLSITAGARTVCMLPNIGCATNHINLQRDFGVKSEPAKDIYDHWHVFKEIANSPVSQCDWRACLLFFSYKWIEELHNNSAWSKLRSYLYELAWQRFDYARNHINYDLAFSVIQRKRNLKPNPYIADTAQHLLTIASGAAPGFSVAYDDELLPLKELQSAFVHSYGLKKHIPTIMQPSFFNFEHDNQPIYYSLAHPSTLVFSPTARKMSSTLHEMRELEHITRIYAKEIARDEFMCYSTIMNKAAKMVSFKYYHNRSDPLHVVNLSKDIILLDPRFEFSTGDNASEEAVFASDSPFLRGCIAIHPALTK